MDRANAMVPPEAIRIEDEVWQEAFTRREPSRVNRRDRLQALEGGQGDWLGEPPAETFRQPARRSTGPSTAGARRKANSGRSNWSAAPPPRAANGTDTSTATVVEARIAATAASVAPEAVSPTVRRTVKIQGRGAERNLPWPDASRRRPPRRPYERDGFRPDRLAMWAVMLGFMLVLVAIVSGHA